MVRGFLFGNPINIAELRPLCGLLNFGRRNLSFQQLANRVVIAVGFDEFRKCNLILRREDVHHGRNIFRRHSLLGVSRRDCQIFVGGPVGSEKVFDVRARVCALRLPERMTHHALSPIVRNPSRFHRGVEISSETVRGEVLRSFLFGEPGSNNYFFNRFRNSLARICSVLSNKDGSISSAR